MVAAGLLVFTSLLSLALGRPTAQADNHVLHRRANVPQGFTYRQKASQESVLNLRIALVQNNATGLETALYDVSNPLSENYGHHLTKTEVEKLVAPSPESLEKVTAWLKNNGLTPQTISPAGDWLSVKVPISKANTLISADYNEYVVDKTNQTELRTLAYSIPESLKGHLAFIYPTTQFIEPASRATPSFQIVDLPRTTKKRGSRRAQVPAACDQQITPECLIALYNIPTTPASASGNSLGVSGFIDEIANKDDLAQFLSVLRPDFTNGTFDAVSIDKGITDTASPGTVEATLDIQYTVGLATNVPTTFFSVGNQNQDGQLGGFLDIINFLLAQDQPPLVLSTSFGFSEAGFAAEPELATTLCNAYGQLGARGTSIVFASGDGGVSGPQASKACDGKAFVPTFPSGCPFLTSVGSTQGIDETAAPFSSGGFSNVFKRPAYQDAAVAAYLQKLGNTNAGLFNTAGRAFPDVSTQGVNFVVDVAGQGQGVSGTSASSPTFASVVALLNDALLSAGKAPLGFLNPLLYSQGAAALNDVTTGSNPGCGTDGFPALEGWDPVTGLGTPDFAKLLTLVTGSAAAGDGNNGSEGGAAAGNSTASATESASTSAAAASTSSASVSKTSKGSKTTSKASASTTTETASASATASDASASSTENASTTATTTSAESTSTASATTTSAATSTAASGKGASIGGINIQDILNDPAFADILKKIVEKLGLGGN